MFRYVKPQLECPCLCFGNGLVLPCSVSGCAAGTEPCARLCAARLGRSAGRNPKQRCWRVRCQPSRRRARDLLPGHLPPSIFDLHCYILPLTHHYLALRRSVLPTLRLHQKQPIVITHHPVVADDSLALQPEDLPQLRRARCLAVIILGLRCRAPEALVVLRQMVLLKIHVGLLVRPNLPPPHLLDQPVLMRAPPGRAPLALWPAAIPQG